MAGELKPMGDQSHLDKKYFIDPHIYNCPFCNRRHVTYTIKDHSSFHWTEKKLCHIYLVMCNSCSCWSMHLSFEELRAYDVNNYGQKIYKNNFGDGVDIDSHIFYSVPTSFFTLDDQIPAVIRELITEAEGCLKMNYLTGASACMRKAIYELLIFEKAEGDHYEERIKALKNKYSDSDPALFDILFHIQDMTSDKIHEQSWPKWESKYLKLIIETLKTILHDIYVFPKVKAERYKEVQRLREALQKDAKSQKG